MICTESYILVLGVDHLWRWCRLPCIPVINRSQIIERPVDMTTPRTLNGQYVLEYIDSYLFAVDWFRRIEQDKTFGIIYDGRVEFVVWILPQYFVYIGRFLYWIFTCFTHEANLFKRNFWRIRYKKRLFFCLYSARLYNAYFQDQILLQ